MTGPNPQPQRPIKDGLTHPSPGTMSPPMSDEKTLLIVEDDRPLRERLARAMETRGFSVAIAESVAEIVWEPAVLSVAGNVPVPLVKAEFGGNVTAPSVLVKCTVPV